MTSVGPVALAFSLIVAAVLLVIVVVLVWWIDRYDREPWPIVLLVFLWGMVVAPGLVIAVGGLIQGMGSGFGFSLPVAVGVAPLIEELAKGGGILLVVVFSQHFDNPTDGLVYGTAVGLGFAVTENLLYGLWSAPELGQAQALAVVFGRTLFTAGVHALASSIVGAGLGFGRMSGRRLSAFGWALLGLAVAVILHGGWNAAVVAMPSEAGWVFPAMILAPMYLIFGVSFGLMLWGEHRILVSQLSEEVALGVLPDWAGRVIPYYRRRVRADWWPSRQERIVISRLLTRLAFRKHALQARGDSANIEGLEIVRLRAKIQGILGKPEIAQPSDDLSDTC